MVSHKGVKNEIFLEWAEKYFSYDISSNYISFNDNTIKTDSREVFVTNYGNTKSKTAVVFDYYKKPRENTEISQMCLAF